MEGPDGGMEDGMRLLLVRHGATPNNIDARYTGQSDVPMSVLGESQADALARRLASAPFDLIVSSDLDRARATAERIARQHVCELRLDPDLREVGMGEWEGMSVAAVADRYRDALARWEHDPIHYAPPGGESLEQFAARAGRAIDRWTSPEVGERVLVVTHGGVVGVIVCLALGLPLEYRRQFARDNTSITELDLQPDPLNGTEYGGVPSTRRVQLVRLNDTAHLEGLMRPGEGEARQVL